MAERVWGDICERTVQEFSADDAGQKVGWTTVIPSKDADYPVFHVVGAYATIGEHGASVSVIEDTSNDKRLWHDHLAVGLSRACSYAILVIPGEDTRIRNTDTVRFDHDNAKDLAGHSFHHKFNVDDQNVAWGKGDEELVANLRQTLEQHNLAEEYSRIYLTINGGVGHGTHRKGFPLAPSYVANNQIYDPSMSSTASEEMKRFYNYALILGEQGDNDSGVMGRADVRSLTADEFIDSRARAHIAFLRVQELRQMMIAPRLAYTPEGYDRTWPYMDASEENTRVSYGVELDELKRGNFARLSYELEREIKELERRRQYAIRGALTMFTLTVNDRQ